MQRWYIYFCVMVSYVSMIAVIDAKNEDDFELLQEQLAFYEQLKNIDLNGNQNYNELDFLPHDNSIFQDPDLQIPQFPHQECDDKSYQEVTIDHANIVGSTSLLTVANPVGIVSIVTVVATLLVIDQLAKMKIINPTWTLARMKEKIFGVPVYEGDEYYKNWRNPQNLERKFPSFDQVHYPLLKRAAYEQEMSQWLVVVEKMMDKQESLKKLPWPDDAYKKLLNFNFVVDPIYISENEEFQLDERLTRELTNCRASAIASVKNQISQLYAIFESLANELIHQLKNVVQDFKKFKIDSKFVVLLGIIVSGVCMQDESDDQNMYVDDLELCLAGLNKKSMVKLFTHASEYGSLLEDFEKIVDCSQKFFMEYKPAQARFLQDGIEDSSQELMLHMINDGIQKKKDHLLACLQEITKYCTKIGQGKVLPDLMKFLKKMSINRLKKYHKNIEKRFEVSDIQTLDIGSFLSSFFDDTQG